MNKERIKKYLEENLDVAVDIARECDSWDGRFSNKYDTWDLSELVQCYCGDYESTRRFVDTLLNSLDTLTGGVDDPVRFSEYGDYIESVDDDLLQEEVEDDICDIVDAIEELYPANIDIYDNELKELLECDLESIEEELYEIAEERYKGSEINADVLLKIAKDDLCIDDEDLLKDLEDYLVEKEKTYAEE